MTIVMNGHKPTSHGLTLIELILVVAILGLLAAVAIPNLLQAQIRAKVGRVKSEMQGLATGLEAYVVDWNTYPQTATGLNGYIGFVQLTTPVSYATSFFPDIFNTTVFPEVPVRLYDLGTGKPDGTGASYPSDSWVLVSMGPDNQDNTRQLSDFPFTEQAWPYDPTNGLVSQGDIYRLKVSRRLLNFESRLNPTRIPPTSLPTSRPTSRR